jgi:histidine triad (HIT) family protein
MVPVVHRETVFDLTDAEIAASFSLLREIKKWMDQEYNPDGYNVGWNCYPVGGQSIPHAHMHIIPRFKREPLAGRGIRHHLKSKENQW